MCIRDRFVEDGFLNHAALVDACAELFEVDSLLDRGAQAGDEFDVDIGFYERVADLFHHAIKGLFVEGCGACQVRDGGVDAPAKVGEDHGRGCVLM